MKTRTSSFWSPVGAAAGALVFIVAAATGTGFAQVPDEDPEGYYYYSDDVRIPLSLDPGGAVIKLRSPGSPDHAVEIANRSKTACQCRC